MTVAEERPAVSAAATTQVRLVVGLQMFFWVGYLLVLALLLFAAARHGGFDFAPFHVVHDGYNTAVDPDVLGLGIPGHILHIPLAIVVLAGTWPGAFVALAGCVLLAAARPIDSSLRSKLIVSTALTLAFVAVQLSPFGELVRKWMLD